MKRNLLISGLVVVALVVLSAAVVSRANDQSNTLENKAALVCRAIGDQLLQQSGDTHSRVLPVNQIADGVFRIEFQNTLNFASDSMVNIVQSNVLSSGLPENYTVNVFKCSTNEVVYGFQINPRQKDIEIIDNTGQRKEQSGNPGKTA